MTYKLLVTAAFFLMACSSIKKGGQSRLSHPKNTGSSALQQRYSAFLGVPPAQLTNLSLYNFIEEWLKTPYAYGGQSKKGVDCSGFTQLLFSAVYQKKIPRNALAQYDALSSKKSARQLEEGDLVFFKTEGSKKVNHVGVYLHNQKMINATTGAGVIISDMKTAYWSERFYGAGAFK
jgi:lipoprotein Spr